MTIFFDSLKAQKYYFDTCINNNSVNIVYNKENDSYSFVDSISSYDDEVVLEIEDLGYIDDYVYDIETQDGTFQAGVGSLIVKNTDSVFIEYKGLKEDINLQDKEQVSKILEFCFEKGEIIASEATKMFKEPILLEFEKVYLPLIMLGKKMYIGSMYEPPRSDKCKTDKKGIVLKRRDNPNITKIIYQGIIDILFSDGKPGINRCIRFLDSEIQKILNQQVSFKDLVITKTYKTNYKSENIPHKILAEKMMKRDPGSAPNVNDRVPYVFVETKDKHAKQYEKVEHPDYAQKHNLKIDSIYYVSQIRNPITQLLSTFIDEKKINNLFDHHFRDYELKKQRQPKITQFLKKKN